MKPILFLSLIFATLSAFCADHVYFPEWRVSKISPEKFNSWDIGKAFRQQSGERTDISLNGFWKFMFCEKEQDSPPPFSDDWGYYLVPSYWREGAEPCNLFRTADGRAVDKFRGKPYQDYRQGWYYREFITPPECAERQTLLKFDALYAKGIVIINGKKVPLPEHTPKVEMSCPFFSVDITGYLRPAGEKNTIYIATAPDDPPGDFTRAGLQDNVWLCIRPKQNFGQPRISTFVKDKKLRIDFGYGTLPENFNGQAEFTVRDSKDGRTVHTESRPYAPTVELDYITPKLWDLDEPNLYYLDCKLMQNGKIVDAATLRFGFRELTAEKGRFLLNGKPIMINTESSWGGMWNPLWYSTKDMSHKFIRTMKKFGINSAYTQRMLSTAFYDAADEVGYLCVEKICLYYEEYRDNSPEQCLKMWEALAEEFRRSGRLDNHPSVAAVLTDVYFNASPSGNNPAYIGLPKDAKQRRHIAGDGKEEIVQGGDPNLIGERIQRSLKTDLIASRVKDYFPDAEVLTGAGAHVKDAYGIHIYHTWRAPYAELAALFKLYSKDRQLPIYCGEYAVPYHGSFAHLSKWGQIRNNPELVYWQENAARVLGPAAYREKTVTVPFAWDGPYNDLLASNRGRDGMDKDVEYYFIADIFAKTLADSINRTIFFWRYDGLSGLAPFEYIGGRYITAMRSNPANPELEGDLTLPGVKPASLDGTAARPMFNPFGGELDIRPNLVSTPFLSAMSQIVCKLIGSGEDCYENDHSFWGGETLSKAVGVINMSGKALDYQVEISLLDDSGAVAASTRIPFRMEAYTQKSAPFQLTLPQVGVRREYTLRAVFKPQSPDCPELVAALPLQVFPAVRPTARRIQLYGNNPAFVSALKKLGYDVVPVDSFQRLIADRVLVIAPGAFRDQKELPDFSVLAEKGIQTLIMEQSRKASPELLNIRSRQAFINAPAHPVLAGLTDVDFSDWRGSHSLDPAYGVPERGEQWVDWGNRGMVAANVFRRPQTGNYLSLLVSGFDLFQTPLLEYRGQNGSWLGSQLEIGGRLPTDPVATTVFCRMVDYLAERRSAYGDVGFFGGEKGRGLLKKFGVEYKDIDPADMTALNGLRLLIISDPDWKKLVKSSFNLSGYVYDGGKILYLHTGKEWYGSWLPFLMEMKMSGKCDKALSVSSPDGNWMNGWSDAELYWRGALEVPEFSNYPLGASATRPAVLVRMKHGSGSYFFSSLTPETFRQDQMAAAKYGRLISALLTTHGARMENSASPYRVDLFLTLLLKDMQWEFALDPNDDGLAKGWQNGGGSVKWLSGQQTQGGEFVRPGIGYEAFLGRDYSGVSWYRLRFKLTPAQAETKNMRLETGHMHTGDKTFINGREIGSRNDRSRRYYRIPDGLLKPGVNTLMIRIENSGAPGGLVDSWIRLTNTEGEERFWKQLYPGGGRDYDYNPDWVRQY